MYRQMVVLWESLSVERSCRSKVGGNQSALLQLFNAFTYACIDLFHIFEMLLLLLYGNRIKAVLISFRNAVSKCCDKLDYFGL